MPKEDQKTTFIVTTSSAHGAWYPEKKSTLSLINSHVANRKVQQAGQRRAQSGKGSRQTRPRKKASVISNVASESERERQSEKEVVETDVEPEDKTSWSLDELKDIFGDQSNNDTEVKASKTTFRAGQRINTPGSKAQPDRPRNKSDISGGQEYQYGVDRRGAGSSIYATGPQDLALRLPHRVEAPSLGGPQSADKTSPPSQQRKAVYSPPTILKQIETILDPFLRLATKVSPFEQHLLHFYLTEGRQVLYGTSAQPAYCPALHAASRGVLQRSPAYVETHIAIAEHLLCKLRSEQVSANFFQRRADAYKTVGDLILDPDAEFDDQLCGLICLQTAEHTVGRSDLQAVHLKAMHQLVERRGGIQFFHLLKDPDAALTEPMLYANQYMFARFEAPKSEYMFIRAKDDFVSHLRRIVAWVLRVQGFENTSNFPNQITFQERSINRRSFANLSAYLQIATDKYLREDDTPYHQAAGVFHLLYNLCITLMAFDLSSKTTPQFLALLQSVMENSADAPVAGQSQADESESSELFSLHPSAVTSLVSHLRRKISREAVNQKASLRTSSDYHYFGNFGLEVSLSDATINAMKIFPFLSFGTRLRISRALFRSALSTSDVSVGEGLGDLELQDLDFEISRAYDQP